MKSISGRWARALSLAGALALAACGGSSGSSSSGSSGSGTSAGSGSSGSSGTTTTGTSSSSSSSGSSGTTGAAGHHLVLLHTNDLHGHLEGHAPELDYTPLDTSDSDNTRGGFARIAAKVAQERAAAADAGAEVILADDGDFMMGTAFSSFIGTTEATELYEMTTLGYDAINLGNHEFDFTSAGLAATVNAALTRGVNPPLVATNMTVPSSATELFGLMQAQPNLIPKKRIVTLPDGLKVGFVGIMGKNAAAVAPLAAPVTFATTNDGGSGGGLDLWTAVQPVVDDLRNNDHVDLVIALSHSGTDENGNGEDRTLGQHITGVDIIVSGHTHVELPQPVTAFPDGGGPLIVQTGAYGLNLGKMDFTYTPGAGISLDSYALEPIDDTIAGDATVQGRIDGYVNDINNLFTDAGAGFGYFTPLSSTTFDLDQPQFAESGLGDLITDAYRAATRQPDGGEADIAVESSGNIRQPLLKGKTGALDFADIFNVVPLGVGFDAKPGYPLVEVYLTAKDLKSGLELSAAASDPNTAALGLHDNDYFLQLSGVTYTYSLTTGSLFDYVNHIEVGGTTVYDASTMPTLDDTHCYRVVTTYYLASLLGLLKSATGGVLAVDAKQSDCATVYTSSTLPQAIIDSNPTASGTQEIKNYQALLGYIASFGAGGLPSGTNGYDAPQGRIVSQ